MTVAVELALEVVGEAEALAEVVVAMVVMIRVHLQKL